MSKADQFIKRSPRFVSLRNYIVLWSVNLEDFFQQFNLIGKTCYSKAASLRWLYLSVCVFVGFCSASANIIPRVQELIPQGEFTWLPLSAQGCVCCVCESANLDFQPRALGLSRNDDHCSAHPWEPAASGWKSTTSWACDAEEPGWSGVTPCVFRVGWRVQTGCCLFRSSCSKIFLVDKPERSNGFWHICWQGLSCISTLSIPSSKSCLFWDIFDVTGCQKHPQFLACVGRAAGSQGRSGWMHGLWESVGISCSEGPEGTLSPWGHPWELEWVRGEVDFVCRFFLSGFCGH